jgi:hypothetical protein
MRIAENDLPASEVQRLWHAIYQDPSPTPPLLIERRAALQTSHNSPKRSRAQGQRLRGSLNVVPLDSIVSNEGPLAVTAQLHEQR